MKLVGLVNKTARDAAERLQRYEADNIFVSDRLKERFPDFGVTSFRGGLSAIWRKHSAS